MEGFVVIGGEGSLTGALRLQERGVRVVVIPATLDKNISGTDTTIGVDTALHTALEAIDCMKDTASSHQRAQVVEVLGRRCGYLVLDADTYEIAQVLAGFPEDSSYRQSSGPHLLLHTPFANCLRVWNWRLSARTE